MPGLSTGGRRLTMSAVVARSYAFETERSVSRKELAQAAREADKALGLRPTLRLVLHELVGVWGEQEVEGRLLVWPSNDFLVERTGLSERSVRYALAGLVELKLILPKDSANGKRFALRDRDGTIRDAFGFDLTPLYARRGEFAATIAELKRLRELQGRLFDEITICRRATEEALSALRTHFPSTSVVDLDSTLDSLRRKTPRRGFMGLLEPIVELWRDLRGKAEQRFYEAGYGGKDCRHKETDNGPPSETWTRASGKDVPARPSITLGLVLEACPALAYYQGRLRTEDDLVAAARFFRPSIGAHESAWREAIETVGPGVSAAAVVYVLQLHEDDVAAGTSRIRNPGGYFRALVRMIGEKRIDLAAELQALRRRRMT